MTFLDFDGIASGESIVVEGTIKAVFNDNTCNVDIVDPFPENEDLKAKLTVGAEIEYWKILGRIKIVRAK